MTQPIECYYEYQRLCKKSRCFEWGPIRPTPNWLRWLGKPPFRRYVVEIESTWHMTEGRSCESLWGGRWIYFTTEDLKDVNVNFKD